MATTAIPQQENAADVIQETVQEASNAVSETVDTVKDTVSRAVEEVGDTGRVVGETLWRPIEYLQREPLLLAGSAIFLGLAIGLVIYRRSY